MKILFTILLMSLVPASVATCATPDPFRKGLDRLKTSIEELGKPLAGEVSSERAELEGIRVRLERQASKINEHRANVDSEQEDLNRRNRERDSQLRQIEFDRKVNDANLADVLRRGNALRMETVEQKAALAAARTPAEIDRALAWGREGNERIKLLQREGDLLDERTAEIKKRQSDMASDIIGHAQRANWLDKRRTLVDHDTSQTLGELAAALSRALALKEIADHPARTVAYESPDAIAKKVAGDFFISLTKEAAFNVLKSKGSQEVLKTIESKYLFKVLAKVGLQGIPVIGLFTAADVFADTAIAGVDQRTREVTKNLFLIGDYGEVMKRMIQAEGKSATQTSEYLAMRAEIERLAAEMPANDAQVLQQGLINSAAIGTALISAAGNYAGGRAERALRKSGDQWLHSIFKTHGGATVRFFRGSIKSTATATADESVKKSAEVIADAFRRATEETPKP
ncbi:MAG: hypothetical protein ABJF10_00660 [Chthoniobacter sp.]|uniref:hypothetical protein n=1 Tax=Chthoniobacter sp. TaxID=2510640 RepID=UPI0032AC9DA0